MRTQYFAIFATTCFLALTGCVSEQLESYVGKSVTEPMMDMGKPTNIIDLGNNRRAFQWQKVSSGVMPITTPAYGTIHGSNGWANLTATTTNYVPYATDCLYTVTATRKGSDWVVDGFRKPSFECE